MSVSNVWHALAARYGYLFVVHLTVVKRPSSAGRRLRTVLSTERLWTEIWEHGLGAASVLDGEMGVENTDLRLSSLRG